VQSIGGRIDIKRGQIVYDGKDLRSVRCDHPACSFISLQG